MQPNLNSRTMPIHVANRDSGIPKAVGAGCSDIRLRSEATGGQDGGMPAIYRSWLQRFVTHSHLESRCNSIGPLKMYGVPCIVETFCSNGS